jgi:hypothetical protein
VTSLSAFAAQVLAALPRLRFSVSHLAEQHVFARHAGLK